MKRVLALALLATPACADGNPWVFAKGDSRTYTVETILEWSVVGLDQPRDAAPLAKGRQVEQLTLKFETELLEGPNARFKITIDRVRVESGGSGGPPTVFDSKEKNITEFLGFKRFESLPGHTFFATVTPEGEVLSTRNAATPDPALTKATADEHEEVQPLAMHPPTSLKTWVDLVFRATPPSKRREVRHVRFVTEEDVAFTHKRAEKQGGHSCVLTEFESVDADLDINPKRVHAHPESDPNGLAYAACRLSEKRGEAWFARGLGLVKLEGETNSTIGYGKGKIGARMTWKVEWQQEGKGGRK
jgi:hypothetical protein